MKKKKKCSHRNLNGMFRLNLFLHKQPVFKQLALGWQIAKHFSGLKLFPLSNNKNFKEQKSGVLLL